MNSPAPIVFLFSLSLLAIGCAPLQSERLRATAAAFAEPVELHDVPFFPQEDFHCGPAALATVLHHAGAPVTPEQLAPQVYVPQRQGSLQLELLAAARRQRRIPYVLRPQLESLAAEVASGNPVLVLQNLGLSIAPTWHYAVVIGFDLTRGEIVLRSGRESRRVMPLETFEHTWRRADYWGVVVLAPDRLPFTAEELPYIESVAAVERLGAHDVAAVGYATALTRWPTSLAGLIGLGNARHALGDLASAEQAFRRAVNLHPLAVEAHNNLAQTLADLQRFEEAEATARHALTLNAAESLRNVVNQTLEEILRASNKKKMDRTNRIFQDSQD